MRRLFSILFIALYFYNLAGYLLLFSVRVNQIKKEVKQSLKEGVPDSELVFFVFHTASLQENLYHLKWIEPHEFRLGGSMYDIVRSHTSGDSTYFECVNDAKEEELFAHLDAHVHRHMANPERQGALDAFKDLFKNSYTQASPPECPLTMMGFLSRERAFTYMFNDPDVPFLPPRA
jgi:hypothetical protein